MYGPPRTDLPYLRHRRRPPRAEPPPAPVKRPAAARRRLAPVRRTTPDQPVTLTPAMPTAVLTRVQSGVGRLEAVVHWSRPAAGWLIVACQTSDRVQHVLTPADAPLATAGGVRADHRGDTPRLLVDLLHIGRLDRLLLAVTPNGPPRPLEGALTISTYGGGRAGIPVAVPASPGVAVLATLFNVHGELVIRAEHDPVGGTLQDACRAYGYDRITWRDAHTPLR
ncbi:hypothetical protein [Actinoplanes philippinensis]|uniref:hypothetical protein n=1 Tax=Actinoplanes philippinensis TaxID=35752 RepID=UPI0033C9D7E4